jgi:hypothetical protein
MEMINHNEELSKKERIEQRIRLCLKFVKEIEYPYSLSDSKGENNNPLVYVKKLGGLGIDEIERLPIEGFKLRYVNPVQITTSYGKIVNGLSISLEVLI